MRKARLFFAIALTLCTSNSLAISLPLPFLSTTEPFATQPSAADWSTAAVIGGSGDDESILFLSASVNSLAVSAITTPLASVSTVGSNALAVWNSVNQNVQTAPAGNRLNVLLATITNNTGFPILSLNVHYDLGMLNNNVTTSEALPGHEVYYSTTGQINSWHLIGAFGFNGNASTPPMSPQTVNFSFTGLGTPYGSTFYMLWADDNAASNPDGIYTLDNVTFTSLSLQPEPSSFVLAGFALVALLTAIRRRRC